MTGQLIALDIGAIAPLIAFAGVALILFVKQKKVQFAGGIIAGLGILFLGMGMMSAAMIPLRDSQHFVNLMTKFSNPFLVFWPEQLLLLSYSPLLHLLVSFRLWL